MSTVRSKSKTITAAGVSDAIPIDLRRFHMGVGLICTLSSGGTAQYTIEVSGDDPRTGFTNWNKHDLLQNLTASANGNLAFPVTAVRINSAALIGSLTLSVIQPIGTA